MWILNKEIRVDQRLIRKACLRAEQFEYFADPLLAIESLRSCGTRIDVFTFVEGLTQTSPRYDYPTEWDNLAALPVSTFDTWWTKQINAKTRNMVRRAEKMGVTVRKVSFDNALVKGISGIYNESAIRQGKNFSHYRKDLETVRQENETFLSRSVFIGAFLGDTLIGFAKVVSDECRRQAGLMQIISMISERDKAPTNALIAEAVRSCAEQQIPYLFYSHFAYGKKGRDTLSDFKQHNGFQRVDVPRYYVPLTLVGQLALRVGLHRRLIEQVPESVQSTLRTWRSRWMLESTRKHS